MNKKLIGALIGIIAIAIALYMLKSTAKPATQEPEVANTSVALAESRPYCFAYVQAATPDAPYAVEEHMALSRVRGAITGKKTGTQSGPDMTNGYEGGLSGEATSDGTIELVFAYKIEGSEGKELEIYKIDGANLLKQKYILNEETVEGQAILVPDRTTEPTSLLYKVEQCRM